MFWNNLHDIILIFLLMFLPQCARLVSPLNVLQPTWKKFIMVSHSEEIFGFTEGANVAPR